MRIFINNELGDIDSFWINRSWRLNVGERFTVISFHSLEDRIIKQFCKTQ